MGQKGTFEPSSWEMARAKAVLPVPGAPTRRRARPENLRDLIRSTTTPQAWEGDPNDFVFILGGMRGDGSHLSSVCLADETSSIGGGVTVLGETETFYMRMDGYTR